MLVVNQSGEAIVGDVTCPEVIMQFQSLQLHCILQKLYSLRAQGLKFIVTEIQLLQTT